MKQKETSYEIIYGIHAIQECIYAKKRKIYKLYVDSNKQNTMHNILSQVQSYTAVSLVKKNFLDQISHFEEHQGIIAYVAPFIYQKELFSYEKNSIILFCDSIQDTKNLGGLLRSAYCTGITKIILTIKNSAPLSAATSKSSAGLLEHLQIYKSNNAIDTISQLKSLGYHIFLAAANGNNIDEIGQIPKPIVIVIGNEHTGIQKKLFEFGTIISLKQCRSDISYNASVAGGILLYHIQFININSN